MADTQDTYRTVTPYLVVPNADAELAFLTRAFGGVEVDTRSHRGDDGSVVHAEVTIGNSLVMLGQASAQWPAQAGALFLWVDDVDAAYAQALSAGAASESEPADKPYGHRSAGVIDVNGITWWMGAPIR